MNDNRGDNLKEKCLSLSPRRYAWGSMSRISVSDMNDLCLSKKLCIGTIVTYSIVKPHYLYMMLCFRHMSWKIRDTQPLWERSYVALPPIAERTCFTMRKDTITTYCYCVYNGRSMIFHINVWALGLNSIRWILVWSLLIGAYQSILTRVRSSRKSQYP